MTTNAAMHANAIGPDLLTIELLIVRRNGRNACEVMVQRWPANRGVRTPHISATMGLRAARAHAADLASRIGCSIIDEVRV